MREAKSLSSDDDCAPQHTSKSIPERLNILGVVELINAELKNIETTVAELRKSMNSVTDKLQKVKTDLDTKADKTAVEAMNDEMEDLEKSQGKTTYYYTTYQRLRKKIVSPLHENSLLNTCALKLYVSLRILERAHRTPTRMPFSDTNHNWLQKLKIEDSSLCSRCKWLEILSHMLV